MDQLHKRFTSEQIINKLKKVEVMLSNGTMIGKSATVSGVKPRYIFQGAS